MCSLGKMPASPLVCLFLCLPAYLESVYPPVCLFVSLSTRLTVYLSPCLSACVCPPKCLTVSAYPIFFLSLILSQSVFIYFSLSTNLSLLSPVFKQHWYSSMYGNPTTARRNVTLGFVQYPVFVLTSLTISLAFMSDTTIFTWNISL